MNTHLVDPHANRLDEARPLTVCNVRTDRASIVKKNPTCTWCQRWLEQRTLTQIAGAPQHTVADDDLPF